MRYDIRGYETERRVEALVAKALLDDSHITDITDGITDRVQKFAARGHSTYAKALLSTADGIAETQSLSAALIEAATAESVEGMLAGSRRIGLGSQVRIMLGTIEGAVVGEAEEKVVGELEFTLGGAPIKIHAETIVSAEALRAIDSSTQSAVRAHLVSALARATDVYLVTRWTSGPATVISGDAAGIGALLDALSGGKPRRPYVLADFATLLSLAPSIRDLRDIGIGVVPVPAVPTGTIIAADASGMLFQDTSAEVSTARHASVAMGSPPSAVSLWQSNLAALRAERWLRHEYAPTAIAWGSV